MKTEPIPIPAEGQPYPTVPSPAPPRWLVVAAFAAIYGIWGSTYLAIRYAVTTTPPFLMAAMRFLLPGILLYALIRGRSGLAPTRAEWRHAIAAGTLMLAIGNGAVSWAALVIPSGVVSLVIAMIPIWMVLIDWARPGGIRPARLVLVGSVIGFGGVLLLGGSNGGGRVYGWGLVVLIGAALSWAAGSLYCRGLPKTKLPLLAVSMQMLVGGGLLLILAIARGELHEFSWSRLTPLSIGAWLYLSLAGSLVAYTAYIWLLQVLPPARVATYAYVNPLIAVVLGCTLGSEPFSERLLAAASMIILAVVLIVRSGNGSRRPP